MGWGVPAATITNEAIRQTPKNLQVDGANSRRDADCRVVWE